MFDLEQEIGEWRERLLENVSIDSDRLRELESHLREDIERRITKGAQPTEAFMEAKNQLGQSTELGSEYAKVHAPKCFSGWKTYLSAALLVIPAFLAWSFTALFLIPKARIVWSESGIDLSNQVAIAIVRFGHNAFAFGHWFLLVMIVFMMVIEKVTQVSPKVRMWLAGSAIMVLNAMVFTAFICAVVSLLYVAPVMSRKANFLARYSNAAGVLAVAEQRWNASESQVKFGLNPDGELLRIERIKIETLLDILDGGATVGVRRGTVGSLLLFEDHLRQRKEWSDRFLGRLNELADQRFDNMDDAVAWYHTVAGTLEWKAAL